MVDDGFVALDGSVLDPGSAPRLGMLLGVVPPGPDEPGVDTDGVPGDDDPGELEPGGVDDDGGVFTVGMFVPGWFGFWVPGCWPGFWAPGPPAAVNLFSYSVRYSFSAS
jgi:hypothetical protein